MGTTDLKSYSSQTKEYKTSHSPFFGYFCFTNCAPSVCHFSLNICLQNLYSFLLNYSVQGAFGHQSLQKEPARDNK